MKGSQLTSVGVAFGLQLSVWEFEPMVRQMYQVNDLFVNILPKKIRSKFAKHLITYLISLIGGVNIDDNL